MIAYLLVIAFSVCLTSAVRNGETDVNNEFPFAGIMLGPSTSVTCPNGPAYYGCGVTLIDADDWGFPSNRVVVTAAHCVDTTRPTSHAVSFAANPDLQGLGTCSIERFTTGFGPGVPYYNVQDIYVLTEDRGLPALGPGVYKEDFALMVLAEPVEGITPVRVAGPTQARLRLDTVATFGYGTEGFFSNSRPGGGKPISQNGPRQRMYVRLNVASIQNTNIVANMVYARGDSSLCNADSGSAAFSLISLSNGAPLVYGVVSHGDKNCKATNTYTRIDTEEFHEWASSILAPGN